MNKLTPEQLMLLNQKIVSDEKVLPKVTDNELKEIAEFPYQKDEQLFYKYKTVAQKSAALGNIIAIKKPFVKANKETAVLALLTLLDINGYKMVDYKKDINELYECLEQPTTDDTCKWIDEHMQKEDRITPILNS